MKAFISQSSDNLLHPNCTEVCDVPFRFKQKHSSTNHQDTIAYSRYIADCLVEVYHTSFLIPSFLAPIFRISIALIVMIMIIKLDAACSLASIYKRERCCPEKNREKALVDCAWTKCNGCLLFMTSCRSTHLIFWLLGGEFCSSSYSGESLNHLVNFRNFLQKKGQLHSINFKEDHHVCVRSQNAAATFYVGEKIGDSRQENLRIFLMKELQGLNRKHRAKVMYHGDQLN
ncbi:hypothetical protein POM88_004373 [Heracleum sosnowskyi]|uniref:Uncharacterized protein n=1 Tax=Heracleum sosnowskyi TaxID=360622 RepID=A0AAD8JJ81_9APIA|nr:hypothetical protein POM88_004373 [Heracleum sosnowskyi]